MPVQFLFVASLIFSGAIFGIFYAWVSTTMWGLDVADPRIAIDAMKSMNASVRNAYFFPAFFLTPFVLAAASFASWYQGIKNAAVLFAGAAVIYLAGCFAVTAGLNVPMNEALAATATPSDLSEARKVWLDYSSRWQFWNIVRTFACFLSLLAVGFAGLAIGAGATRSA